MPAGRHDVRSVDERVPAGDRSPMDRRHDGFPPQLRHEIAQTGSVHTRDEHEINTRCTEYFWHELSLSDKTNGRMNVRDNQMLFEIN